MQSKRRFRPILLAALVFACACASGQQNTIVPHGIVESQGDLTLQVVALRKDVLRVRMWKGSNVPEDASWAVLPAARTSSAEIARERHGFSTQDLRVELDERLGLTVSDRSGNILEKDAAPVRWDGEHFTLYKRRGTEDHFFGLGDKAGPLDHAGEAFTLWNTDSFGWQETTDPLYKSIPFFLHTNHGRTVGVFLDNTFRSDFDFGRASPSEYTMGASGGPNRPYPFCKRNEDA